ncbi:MAG: thioredoxin family protein [Myxococcota bacterium]|jgi:thioredoxin 1
MFMLMLVVTATGCGDNHSGGLTDANFDAMVLQAKQPVMVMFFLPTCPHCQRMQQPVDELTREMSAQLEIFKMDVSEYKVQAIKYGVGGVPTFIMFKGGENVATTVGEMPKADLKSWIEGSLEN